MFRSDPRMFSYSKLVREIGGTVITPQMIAYYSLFPNTNESTYNETIAQDQSRIDREQWYLYTAMEEEVRDGRKEKGGMGQGVERRIVEDTLDQP